MRRRELRERSVSIHVDETRAAPSFGQTFFQITGLVTDPSGVVVGVPMTVTNPQTSLCL